MSNITPKEFLKNNPLQLEVHEIHWQGIRNILWKMQRDYALQFTEEEGSGPELKMFYIISPVTTFATTYYIIGKLISEYLDGGWLGFHADKHKP